MVQDPTVAFPSTLRLGSKLGSSCGYRLAANVTVIYSEQLSQ